MIKLYPDTKSASVAYAYARECRQMHVRLAEDEEQNSAELQRLIGVKQAIASSTVDELNAKTIKEIAYVL